MEVERVGIDRLSGRGMYATLMCVCFVRMLYSTGLGGSEYVSEICKEENPELIVVRTPQTVIRFEGNIHHVRASSRNFSLRMLPADI